MNRSKRKEEHIKYALETGSKKQSGFEDITFVHNSLPSLSLNSVCLNNQIGELLFSSPIFINAMTGGGGELTYDINKQLSIVAKETGIALAVGSQMAALKDPSEERSFKVIRAENKDGLIFSNLGMDANVEDAKRAVAMIEADALQIHLNPVQELTMPEGDRNFTKVLKNLEEIRIKLDLPLIVKEVGYGMSRETVAKLESIGVFAIDIGGYGGTNFSEIENMRRAKPLEIFNNWGIKTAASLIEATREVKQTPIFASGGIESSLQLAKAIALGAEAVGLAGSLLKVLVNEGPSALIDKINNIKDELKYIMAALGASNLQQLGQQPLVISGETHHWLNERGIKTNHFANR